MNRLLTMMLLGAVVVFGERAIAAERDSGNVWVPGVLFSFGTTDGSIVHNGNALSVWLGAGYDLSSSWRISALFSTGHLHVDPVQGRPVVGTLLLGAGTLEILYVFPSGANVSPFIGGNMGISTILDGQSLGYNGWVVGVRAGLEWKLSAALALNGFAGWNAWTWQNGVGDNIPAFGTFHVSDIDVGLSVIFHPVFPV